MRVRDEKGAVIRSFVRAAYHGSLVTGFNPLIGSGAFLNGVGFQFVRLSQLLYSVRYAASAFSGLTCFGADMEGLFGRAPCPAKPSL